MANKFISWLKDLVFVFFYVAIRILALFVGGFLLLSLLVVYISKPNIPEVKGAPDYDAGIYCLRDIPKKYDPDFFTFKAWAKIWCADHASKIGFEMTQSHQEYYKRYIQIQIAVDCYIGASNDSSLNMALSPTQFEAVYNIIAGHHGLEKIKR